ncbi:thiosulfate sulfurtransferase [bacterium BMS3Bbin12]|nr:thiosulfate sulfurtransferase [bacterium BMS3Abin12]GBE46986.1 thiosulfate sulfurtransferase [bacterium BMS3Bbin12]GBE49491.1 thiosulfate sulfurtransferase [bacterium BMS3Bbin13]HDO33934.1 sulfurtransferase [Chromatiales bacterium]
MRQRPAGLVDYNGRMARALGVVLAFALMVLPVSAAVAAAGYPDGSLLANFAWLRAHQQSGNVQIVDVREPGQFALLHIPTAVDIPFSKLRTPSNGPLSAAAYARIFGAHGIQPGKPIVVSGDPGSFDVTYTLWALNYIGLDHARVYFGGIQDWIGHGGAIARGLSEPIPVTLPYRVVPQVRESAVELEQALSQKTVIPLDARTIAEFDGIDVRALRGGHIPGAVNIDYTRVYQHNNPQTGRLKSAAKLEKLFKGLDPGARYATYCQTGVRASMMYFTLRLMGFPRVAMYPQSWQVWGSDLALPTADTTYLDIPRITGAVAATAGRLDALESLVGQMVQKNAESAASGVSPGLVYGAYILAGLALLFAAAGVLRRTKQ